MSIARTERVRDQSAFAAQQRYVRILNRRSDGFVEFVFSIDDPDLGVELILPQAAFAQFCATNQVRMMTPAEAAECDAQATKWRFGQIGISE